MYGGFGMVCEAADEGCNIDEGRDTIVEVCEATAVDRSAADEGHDTVESRNTVEGCNPIDKGCNPIVEGCGDIDEGCGDVGGGRGDIDEDCKAINKEDVLADTVRASIATSPCVEVSRMGCKQAHSTVVTPSPPSVSPTTCSSTSPTLASFFRSLGPLT